MARNFVGKINLTSVRELQPGDELRDVDLKGFGVRRQHKATSYFVRTPIHGRLKRITIGKHGSPWTPDAARKRATELIYAIRLGRDPAHERDVKRRQAITFDEVAQQFLEIHGAKLKPRTLEEYGRLIRRQLSDAFSNKPLSDIDAAAVSRAHASWRKTPRAANHALAVLSAMLNWAQTQGLREGANPCDTIQHYRETKRERYLTEDELVRLGIALLEAESAGENPYVVALVRLLILTGARLNELLTLRWRFVDAPRSCLRLPDSKTGAKIILLSPDALQVLSAVPSIDGNPWVFVGHIHGSHLVNVQKPWRAIRKRVGIDDVRLHDLRYSFASIAIDLGGTLPVIGHSLAIVRRRPRPVTRMSPQLRPSI
ncbi:MAG: tyrosine-type recombinase/integrase [Nitrospiraceae bacterium]